MSRALVAGIGSPFGADRTGWRAVEAWRDGPGSQHNDVDVVLWDRPGTALLPEVSQRPRLVLVDALVGGDEPGAVHTFTTLEPLRAHPHPYSSHGVGLAEALALAQALGDLPENWVVLGVSVHPHGEVPPLASAPVAIEAALFDPPP